MMFTDKSLLNTYDSTFFNIKIEFLEIQQFL